jgi:hypothetical protein
LKRSVLLLSLGLLAALANFCPVRAQQPSACDQFAWSIARERAMFNTAKGEVVNAGESLPSLPKAAFGLNLDKGEAAHLVMPPERSPKNLDSLGGSVTVAKIERPGLYQVTLSDEAWVDAIQNGAFLKPVAVSGKHGCAEVRKSIRFELKQGPLVLQLTGAEANTIKIAIVPAN